MPNPLHTTDPAMVRRLLRLTPLSGSVLDAGSGASKVWFRHLRAAERYECEIEEGGDFFQWATPVDWVIGNPPFHESWRFFEKAATVARRGIAFLINNQALNSMTPARWRALARRGFYPWRFHVTGDPRWFGRYYFVILMRRWSPWWTFDAA